MTAIQRKICLLGDYSVGKTSLVRRFVEGQFDDKYLSTIGVRISRRTMLRADRQINLLIWDLAGAQEFNTQSSYLVGVTAALIVCDLTRHETLISCAKYAQQVRAIHPAAPLIFVGNKVDLTAARAITEAELRANTELLRGDYLLASAKTGQGVEAAFDRLTDRIEALP
jgi:small GTP-binding protein